MAIVGAGLSGLVAARQLRRAGKSVVVLEARDRIGGRVKAGKVAGRTVDVGGMWVGPTQTRLLALVEECGLRVTPQYLAGKNVSVILGKRRLHDGEDTPLAALDQREVSGAFAELDRMSAQIPLDAPWLAPRANELDRLSVADWIHTRARQPASRELLEALIRNIWEAEPSQISLLYLLFYIRSGETMETLVGAKDAAQAFLIREGMHSLAEALGRQVSESVVLRAPVRSIVQEEASVVVHSDQGDWRAERAVVTVPLPLSARIAYSPPLPAERDALTQRMAVGSVIKWYVAYERPFWRDRGLNGLTTDGAPPICVSWDVTPPEGAPGLLAGFIDSRAALQWTARPAEARKALVLDYLVSKFGAEAADATDYEDQNWPAEEWSRGCYSAFMGPGVMTSVGHTIREPHGRVHWAGTEATTKWTGYVEGAIRSGERVAAEVLASLLASANVLSGTYASVDSRSTPAESLPLGPSRQGSR